MGMLRGAAARMKMYSEMGSFVMRYFLSGKAKDARRCADLAEISGDAEPLPASRRH